MPKLIGMKVEIWSDIMCPFCYIGKRRFEKALAQFPQKDKIMVEWKSFQLDPSLQGVVSKDDYFAKKGFPSGQLAAMNNNMKAMAKQEGLEMNMEKTIISNTAKAHQLLQLAKTLGKGNEAEEILFQMYFTEGFNMEDDATIYEAIKRLNMDNDTVREAIKSNAMQAAFQQDLMEAQTFGINGVPYFIFDRKYAISGAQDPEYFLGALHQSFTEWTAKQADNIIKLENADGVSCDINGNCN